MVNVVAMRYEEFFVGSGSQVVSPRRALSLFKAMSFEKNWMRARLLAGDGSRQNCL